MKLIISSLFLIGLAISCTPPKESPPKNQFRSIGDPFFTPDAPRLVQLKDIKIDHQPAAWGSYPKLAMDKGIHGDVLVEIWIDTSGRPIKAGALWGPLELQQAAVDYILRWKFRPYLNDGQSQSCRFRMLMPFRLRAGGDYQRFPSDMTY